MFGDGCEFGFNGAWLIDSMPERRTVDTYRSSAEGVSYLALQSTAVVSLTVIGAGESMVLTWSSANPDDASTSTVPALWLCSWAPSVAQPLNTAALTAAVNEHGNLQHVLAGVEPARAGFGPVELAQKPWLAAEMTEPPVFQYEEIISNERVHLDFLAALAQPGFAFIDGIPLPDLTPGAIGAEGAMTIDEVSFRDSCLPQACPSPPLTTALTDPPVCAFAALHEQAAKRLIGRCIPHNSRAHDHWHMTTKMDPKVGGRDYDFKKTLAMHTDHSHYSGSPGFVAFMQQVEGVSTTKLADGMAIVDEFRRTMPEAFELLSTVPVSHGMRHRLYSDAGAPRDVQSASAFREFELSHDVPVINLWKSGGLQKLVHSETKRTILSSVPPKQYKEFVLAYDAFCRLAEDPKFVVEIPWPQGRTLAFNNHRMLHGRANILTTPRTLHGCYHTRAQCGHKYRLLKMRLVEKQLHLNERWTTHLSDAALHTMAALTEPSQAWLCSSDHGRELANVEHEDDAPEVA